MQSRTPRSVTVHGSSGVELRALRWDGELPGFVLVHGLASNALLWQGVSESLALSGDGSHAVTAIDLRGHGESAVPDSGYDTTTAAADVSSVIDELGLERPVVAGQSWGGNVAVELAARFSGAVGAIALVDGGWIQLRDGFSDWEHVLGALTPPDLEKFTWEQVTSRMHAAHRDWADWAIEATMANLRRQPDGSVRARLARPHHLSILRSMWDQSVTEMFGDVEVPALLIPAGARVEPKLSAVERAAALLPDAQIRWYEDADHDVHAQHPESVALDLLALAERAAPDAVRVPETS